LLFRAPGAALTTAALVARALAETEERAAERVRSGALAELEHGKPRLPLKRPESVVPPGTLLQLDARALRSRLDAVEGFEALAPALPWREGRCEGFSFATLEERGGVARLRITLAGASLDAARAWLAAAGSAVLADVVHGGILVSGGLRLAPAGDGQSEPASSAELGWPEEAVFPPQAPAPEARLRVSPGTLRALQRGHPWVIADDETETGERFAPGTLVALTSSDGQAHGLARSEGARELAAVLWSPSSRPRDVASIEERVARALARRKALLAPEAATDAVRLVHGAADGLPGLAVDRLGPLLRMLVTGRSALPLRERVLAALRSARLHGLDRDPPVIEVMHLRERPPGELACVRLLAGDAQLLEAPLVLHEGKLRFRVDPGLDEPTRPRPGVGFFLDQRENRARLAHRAAHGGRYLNLFAHTGGFSAALLAGGADEVWSVDLSGPYLAQLEQNLELSGLPLERHHTLRREARRCLAELEPALRFAGIVIDPPTAAAAGRRFWSVRRDLEPLAAAALGRLAPGGFRLLTRQDRSGRAELDTLVQRAAASAQVRLRTVEPAPPAADFPALRGFPEAAPFEAVLATLA
jgi:23S rRNA (cytosine1962-C5)-methyltransferase